MGGWNEDVAEVLFQLSNMGSLGLVEQGSPWFHVSSGNYCLLCRQIINIAGTLPLVLLTGYSLCTLGSKKDAEK